AWSATGRPLAIVSNNSTIAIRAYLDLHHLNAHIACVSARTSPDPALLKPHPHLLTNALSALGVPAGAATFLGDSVTDIIAPRAPPLPTDPPPTAKPATTPPSSPPLARPLSLPPPPLSRSTSADRRVGVVSHPLVSRW